MHSDPCQLLPGTVVVVIPHADDEVLACGGTLAQLPRKERIHLVYATDGSQAYTPVLPWRDTVSGDLSQVRMDEARAAAHMLGIPAENIHFLGFPDGQLRRHTKAFGASLRAVLAQLHPDHLLVPFRYDRHPDHLVINRVVTAFLRQGNFNGELFEYFVYYRWQLLATRDIRGYIRRDQLVSIDISREATNKRRALDCFKSQTTMFYPWQDRPILSQNSLDEVCSHPEVFLRYSPSFPGATVLSSATTWIRLVHVIEPMLKKRKDWLLALWRRRNRKQAGRTL